MRGVPGERPLNPELSEARVPWMWEVRRVESGSWRSREGSRKGGRGKPPGAGAGGGGLSMETVFAGTTGITHGGPCAHVRAPRATCTHTRTAEPTQSWLISEAI